MRTIPNRRAVFDSLKCQILPALQTVPQKPGVAKHPAPRKQHINFVTFTCAQTRILGCCLANHIVGPTQPQTGLANQHVATNVVRWLLTCSTQPRYHYMRTNNDNNPDGAFFFRFFPSGSRFSMTSKRFQHGSAVARVQAGHGREVDIKSLPVTKIPGL